MSVKEEALEDTLADLSSPLSTTLPSQERRNSEIKINPNWQHLPAADRRNSTPQLHLSSLLPHAFRSNKHSKRASKDETNNNIIATSHSTDMTAMKADPPASLDLFADRRRMTLGNNFEDPRYDPDSHHHPFGKLSITPMNGSRSSLSSSSDRLPSPSHHEDSTSLSTTLSMFIRDPRSLEPRSAETLTFLLQMPLCVSKIYRENFLEYFHTNYSGEFEHEGLFIASLRFLQVKTTLSNTAADAHSFRPVRAIIRTSARNYDISLMSSPANEDNILQAMFDQAQLSPIRNCKCIDDPKSNEKIYAFDKMNDERHHSKVGVIYQRAEQTTDNEILSNDSMSESLCDFLNTIADRIRLQGFQHYRGDLDIKDDLHGEYSYHTHYENYEIMFNIAPMISSSKANGQFIERKSLVGNAFVCIVFQDPGVEFSPELIGGKVTQVYITVQPNKIDEELYYKIEIWHRSDATSVIDPPGGIYKNDKQFKDYFLTLILNSMNVAIESPALRSRIPEPRQRLRAEELKKLCHAFNFGSITDFGSSTTNSSYPDADIYGEGRPSTRKGSGASVTTPPIVENPIVHSTMPSGDRTSPVTKSSRRLSKLFSVLTGRSGSISSNNVPTNDFSSTHPQVPTVPETTMTLGRTTVPPTKETIKRAPSVKAAPAPVRPPTNVPPQVPPRPPASQFHNAINIQPPTPPVNVPLTSTYNPLNSIADRSVQSINHNNSNVSVLDSTQRNRSNSSPEETVNTAKTQITSVTSSVVEEEDYTSCSSDSNVDEQSNTDEDVHDEKSARPQNPTTTINTPLPFSTKFTL